jgi:hypothetical protein
VHTTHLLGLVPVYAAHGRGKGSGSEYEREVYNTLLLAAQKSLAKGADNPAARSHAAAHVCQ